MNNLIKNKEYRNEKVSVVLSSNLSTANDWRPFTNSEFAECHLWAVAENIKI